MSRGPQKAVIEAARVLVRTRAGAGFAQAVEELRDAVKRLDIHEWSTERARLRRMAAEQEARIHQESLTRTLREGREAEMKAVRASGAARQEP